MAYKFDTPYSARYGFSQCTHLLSAFATVEDLVTHLRSSDARYRAALPAEFLDRNLPPMYITLYFIVTRLPDSLRAVRHHFLVLDPTDLTVDLLEQHLLAAETSVVAPGGDESEGAGYGGAEPRGAEIGGTEPEGAEPGGAESKGAGSRGAETRAAGAGDSAVGGTGAGGAGVTAGATSPRGARTRGAGAGGTYARGTGAGGTGAGGAGAGGAGAGDPSARGAGAGGTGAGAVDPRSGDPGVGGTGARSTGAGGTVQRRPFFVPPPPPSLPPPDSPHSLLPAPSPYAEQTYSFTERREPESRPASPVRTGRRIPRPRPPSDPCTHVMALRHSSVPLRVPLLPPPASSLPAIPDPESDLARATSTTVPRLLAIVVTDPSFQSTAASALRAELVEFAVTYRLDYAASLVAESASDSPPSVGGGCALGTDVLEDRQEDIECLAAAVPHLVAMLLAPEGDPHAPNIPTLRS
ncbi:unnamed protein product [Closterium sp. NIES-53]